MLVVNQLLVCCKGYKYRTNDHFNFNYSTQNIQRFQIMVNYPLPILFLPQRYQDAKNKNRATASKILSPNYKMLTHFILMRFPWNKNSKQLM